MLCLTKCLFSFTMFSTYFQQEQSDPSSILGDFLLLMIWVFHSLLLELPWSLDSFLHVSQLFSCRDQVFIISASIMGKEFPYLFSRPLICSLYMPILWLSPFIKFYFAMIFLISIHCFLFLNCSLFMAVYSFFY